MHTILKSQAEAAGISDISGEIKKYANEYKLWLAHMLKVNSKKNQEEEDMKKKLMPYPMPETYQILMGAVHKDGSIEYELVDDTVAISKASVAQRRNELMGAITIIENEEIAKIVPPGKARLWNMKEANIIDTDNEVLSGIIADYNSREEKIDNEKLNKHIEEKRPAEDTEHLKMMKEKRKQIQDIRLWAAQMHSDIEDLTAEEVFDWKVPSYKA